MSAVHLPQMLQADHLHLSVNLVGYPRYEEKLICYGIGMPSV